MLFHSFKDGRVVVEWSVNSGGIFCGISWVRINKTNDAHEGRPWAPGEGL